MYADFMCDFSEWKEATISGTSHCPRQNRNTAVLSETLPSSTLICYMLCWRRHHSPTAYYLFVLTYSNESLLILVVHLDLHTDERIDWFAFEALSHGSCGIGIHFVLKQKKSQFCVVLVWKLLRNESKLLTK